jgi:tRNA pseudouridine55 synthase
MPEYSAEYYKEGQTLLIDKPKDWTSFNVVNKVRGHLKWAYNIKKIKVGHAGTLDPLATGLLIICTGKNTKKITQYTGLNKEYFAEIELGVTTPSYDLETEADARYPFEHITEARLKETLENHIGKQEQIPPIYSAKNINGKRAYKYAREGKEVEMRPANIEIYELELIKFHLPFAELRIKCSTGTYIRSLARDIGLALNSGARLIDLRRTAIGEFSVNDAIDIDKFEKNA